MKTHHILLAMSLAVLINCETTSTPSPDASKDIQTNNANNTSSSLQIEGDVWVDNWFALYIEDKKIIEDSVSITTERSFNKETFTFDAQYPFVLSIVAKDFKANDTGLEYIGQPNQQIGDGGLIAQFRDTKSGKIITTTNDQWKCLVIHTAPLDKTCASESNPVAGTAPCTFSTVEEPQDWKSLDFDDSKWTSATVFAESDVRPKDGYTEVEWDSNAKLIWTSDLEQHNTILCRIKIEAP